MTEHTRHLVNLGRAFVEAHPDPGWLCAFAGGSVGRGDADEYSDLDLNLYVDGPCEATSVNAVFRDEIVQVHTHSFPVQEQVEADPWGHRFLLESRTIWDSASRFADLRRKAIGFLRSDAGRKMALDTARETVDARKAWARGSVSKGEMYAAGMAAMAAWIDAALMMGYFQQDSVRTSRPLSYLEGEADLHRALTMAWPIEMALDPVAAEDRVSELARYRANLRGCARESGHFALSADQDVLMARKSAREVKNESWVRLAGELYAEAYWLVLTVAASSIDGHMENLPTDLRHSLERLGFKSATEGQVRDLCTCADEIVGRVLDSEAAR